MRNLPVGLLILVAALGILAGFVINRLLTTSERTAFYIEPGVKMLRPPNGGKQVLGKVVVDLHSGKIWGFPTTVDQPYPVNLTSQQPPTSEPFLLGRYDFAAMQRR